jgi:Glutamate racemase
VIGVFDSGFGGLTILRDLRKVLPQYDYLYLGDNARAPYGSRSFETIYRYTLQAVRELFARGCPLVILACNTASAKALRSIQQQVLPVEFPDRRVLGIVRPTAEEIGKFSKTGHIGIFGTSGLCRRGATSSKLSILPGIEGDPACLPHRGCHSWSTASAVRKGRNSS